jgi:hypothetical protein
MDENLDESFADGMESSHCGIAPDENPHPTGSPESIEWLKGYCAAEEERAKVSNEDLLARRLRENEDVGFGSYEGTR